MRPASLTSRPARLGLALACCVGMAAPAEASFGDFVRSIFGGSSAPRPASEPDSAVRTRARPLPGRAKRARTERPRPRPVHDTAIDPSAHPDWYLDDPTLRRGDIVVLDGQVLVFKGGRPPYGPDSFTSLRRSRLLSAAERETVAAMAGLRPDATDEARLDLPMTRTAGPLGAELVR